MRDRAKFWDVHVAGIILQNMMKQSAIWDIQLMHHCLICLKFTRILHDQQSSPVPNVASHMQHLRKSYIHIWNKVLMVCIPRFNLCPSIQTFTFDFRSKIVKLLQPIRLEMRKLRQHRAADCGLSSQQLWYWSYRAKELHTKMPQSPAVCPGSPDICWLNVSSWYWGCLT